MAHEALLQNVTGNAFSMSTSPRYFSASSPYTSDLPFSLASTSSPSSLHQSPDQKLFETLEERTRMLSFLFYLFLVSIISTRPYVQALSITAALNEQPECTLLLPVPADCNGTMFDLGIPTVGTMIA